MAAVLPNIILRWCYTLTDHQLWQKQPLGHTLSLGLCTVSCGKACMRSAIGSQGASAGPDGSCTVLASLGVGAAGHQADPEEWANPDFPAENLMESNVIKRSVEAILVDKWGSGCEIRRKRRQFSLGAGKKADWSIQLYATVFFVFQPPCPPWGISSPSGSSGIKDIWWRSGNTNTL